jgi:predicted Rossmann fold nucleotide-binding protein DprA/Smf involved in DNA uptake
MSVVANDSAMAALLLVNRLSPADAEPLTAASYWNLLDQVPDPAELLGLGEEELAARVGDPELGWRLARLLDAAAGFAVERARVEDAGIRLLSTFDADFPQRLRQRLGRACPPFVLVSGPLGWLDAGGIGVVGSRAVDEDGASVAHDVGRLAAAHGLATVSGLAKGVDQVAMDGALESAGRVIGVPTEGLRRVGRQALVRQHVHAGDLALLSPYAPDAPFSAGTAMGRNKLIYALADVTLVVASDHDRGGTWAGATEALRRGFGRVAVWRGPGEGPGNAPLERKGAEPVADLDGLVDLPAASAEEQLTFDLE